MPTKAYLYGWNSIIRPFCIELCDALRLIVIRNIIICWNLCGDMGNTVYSTCTAIWSAPLNCRNMNVWYFIKSVRASDVDILHSLAWNGLYECKLLHTKSQIHTNDDVLISRPDNERKHILYLNGWDLCVLNRLDSLCRQLQYAYFCIFQNIYTWLNGIYFIYVQNSYYTMQMKVLNYWNFLFYLDS